MQTQKRTSKKIKSENLIIRVWKDKNLPSLVKRKKNCWHKKQNTKNYPVTTYAYREPKIIKSPLVARLCMENNKA